MQNPRAVTLERSSTGPFDWLGNPALLVGLGVTR
jgi:hypothetical protein